MRKRIALRAWKPWCAGRTPNGDIYRPVNSFRWPKRPGEVVLKASCLSAYALLQLGYPVNISVNVNPRQLLNKNFQQTITQTLHDTGLPAKSLILEITESAIVNDMERVGKVLEAIKTLGVLAAWANFGPGIQSLP